MNITITKNDSKARLLILLFSAVVFIAVTVLERVTLNVELGFDEHIFAKVNAVLNSIVSVLLIAGIVTAKNGRYKTHRYIMLTAMTLSVLFLLSYISHHLFAGETLFGDVNKDGMVSDVEKAEAGALRYIYFIILGTHIILAGVSLPFILFTAYRALINENAKHRKLAKVTWPMWFYVAATGPIIYWMISQYY